MSISNSKIIDYNKKFYDYPDNISELTDDEYCHDDNLKIYSNNPKKIHKKLSKYVNKLLSICGKTRYI